MALKTQFFLLQLVFMILCMVSISTPFPRCGDSLYIPSGGIFHRAFEPVLDNERCVWIIGTHGATGYEIDVQYLGNPTNVADSGQELLITGVRYGSPDDPILETHIPSTTGKIELNNTNIVIVTFHSESLNSMESTGFALKFEALYNDNITKTSNFSRHSVLEAPIYDWKYPETATYKPTELTAFVFPPLEHFYEKQQKHVWYKMGALESTEGDECNDSLFVYTFNVTEVGGAGSWEPAGRICGDSTNDLISHGDFVLIIFQSDEVNQFAGFYFSFIAC